MDDFGVYCIDANGPPDDFHENFGGDYDYGYGQEPGYDHDLNCRTDRFENLFPARESCRLGVNVFTDEQVLRDHGGESGPLLQEILRKSNYIQYNKLEPCKEIYWNKEDDFEFYSKNSPLLLARGIEQQQRRFILSGREIDMNMCLLMQVVLSNDATNNDFRNTAAKLGCNFDINMDLDFLGISLLHLLIVDIYNKRGRCAFKLRAQTPKLRKVQLGRLRHMLMMGADANTPGLDTIQHPRKYSALQFAVFLNLDDVVAILVQNNTTPVNLLCLTGPEYQSSLLQLLIGGYYHMDPENMLSLGTECVSSFVKCLSAISGQPFLDTHSGRRNDIFDFKDQNRCSVMCYLEDASSLSRDHPRDLHMAKEDKVYILRELWIILREIQVENIAQTPRYKSFMSSRLLPKKLKMPFDDALLHAIYMLSLEPEQKKIIESLATYRSLQEQRTLHTREWDMPISDDLRQQIPMYSIDPLQKVRETASASYKKIMALDADDAKS